MKKILFVAFVGIWTLTCLWASAAVELPAIAPMPEKFKDIHITKPDPSVPKEDTELLGEWEGVWKYIGPIRKEMSPGLEIRRQKLIIYDVSSSKVKFLNAVGDSPYYAGRGGWSNNESDIRNEGGKKSFLRMPQSGFNIQFTFEDGVIKGTQGGDFSAELKRTK